ncbi:heavy metal translocating P-type ATPase [uncultured Thiohalocapsa sp.]|uniref:heavy metal translocating P-type ATPase n=1 Tax=uncultured Thiohalocapsa sp. TaxID=768990 RepID=UPI0025CBABA2|nr:heavy metal translocating P-type ATPase [uncultured Thiohalocapsa sp.]
MLLHSSTLRALGCIATGAAGSVGERPARRLKAAARAATAGAGGADPATSAQSASAAGARRDRPKGGGEPPSLVDTDVDQSVVLAAGSLGLALIGKLWYPPLLLASLPGTLYNARYTFASAYRHLVVRRQVNVDVLHAVIVGGFVAGDNMALANVPLLLSALRRRIVARVKNDAEHAITDVFRQQPGQVRVVRGNQTVEMPSAALAVGDQVLIEAGETVPVDGVVVRGTAMLDEHLLTGESQPVEREPGETVLALTRVYSGRLLVRVERAGDDTAAARIGAILDCTVHAKTGRQLRAETMVDGLALPSLALGLASMPAIGFSGAAALINAPPRDNLTIAGAVGIMSCLRRLSRSGVLIKDGRVLEMLTDIDTVVFDKTGTLTEETPRIGRVAAVGAARAELLRLVATAEHRQSHPIARAIRRHAEEAGIAVGEPEHVELRPGHGLAAHIDSRCILVGSARFLASAGVTLPQAVEELAAACREAGTALVHVAADGRSLGALELCARPRPEAAAVCRALHARGLTLAIISGDREAPTRSLARELGIDRCFAEVLPAGKANLVSTLQGEGRRVCFVGDGINDAIALKQADVSVSLAGAASAATDTAQVVLLQGGLHRLPELLAAADDSRRALNRTYALVAVPRLAGIVGALGFGLGFLPAVMLNQLGLALGLLNGLRADVSNADSTHADAPAAAADTPAPTANARGPGPGSARLIELPRAAVAGAKPAPRAETARTTRDAMGQAR